MEPMAERGFLVLADISGFTQFVAGPSSSTGLRSSRILLEVVIDRLAPPLAVQEVEGDAVTPSSRSVSTAPSSRDDAARCRGRRIRRLQGSAARPGRRRELLVPGMPQRRQS